MVVRALQRNALRHRARDHAQVAVAFQQAGGILSRVRCLMHDGLVKGINIRSRGHDACRFIKIRAALPGDAT